MAGETRDGLGEGLEDSNVVLVHDYLNQRGGAERVVLELSRMWPAAPLYTSLYRPESTFADFAELDIRTSWLDRLPVDRSFRSLLPLYPSAFWSLGRLDADIVLSSSSGWAHGVRTSERAFHAVYCYTPARWLWADYVQSGTVRRSVAPVAALLRRWDVRSARRADMYIAISQATKDRIRRAYGIEAPIVYPPVDTQRFTPMPRGERLLCVSRLVPYKRLDLIVQASVEAGVGLDVVGVGPALSELRRLGGSSVHFHGRLDDAAVTEMFEHCRGYCQPGREDFGISPVEAQAAGKPVIAFAAGGALETVEDRITGVLFDRLDVGSVVEAIARCDELETSPDEIARRADRFSYASFRRNLKKTLAAGLANRSSVAGD